MSELKMKHVYRQEEAFPTDRESDGSVARRTLTRSELINAYHVAEFVTLTHDGSPVCWPLSPDLEGGRLLFSTGYVYPTKARNAQRNPRVAALFSDPTASGRAGDDPLVLVQGLAEVFDQDLQRNTERYVDQILRKGPILFRLMVRTPVLRQAMVGYLARIWIEVIPRQEYVWERGHRPPELLHLATRPTSFSPMPGIELPEELFAWLPRYTRPPILAYVDRAGWPAAIRVQAMIRRGYIEIGSDIETSEGAPACLTYHRLIGNYWANDTFLVRGHFDAAGRMIPEKVIGFGGTKDDRGLGSLKAMRMLLGFRQQLLRQMEKKARPLPVVRPTPRA